MGIKLPVPDLAGQRNGRASAVPPGSLSAGNKVYSAALKKQRLRTALSMRVISLPKPPSHILQTGKSGEILFQVQIQFFVQLVIGLISSGRRLIGLQH